MFKNFTISLFVLGACTGPGFAAYTFTGLNPVITENFDSLSNTPVVGVVSATVGVTSSLPGSGFDATRSGGTGIAALPLAADAGGGNSGTVYSYGAAASTERALGLVASGGSILNYGFQYVNSVSSGTTIVALQFDFTQENWRSSTNTQNSLIASYAIGSGTITAANYLTAAGFSPVPGLDLVGPAPVTTNGALDGNLAVNQVAKSFVLSGFALAPGESLFVRWADTNDPGNDAGLAIDNLTLTVVPEPSTAILGALAALGLIRRRRH
jgi:uncharacterized protein